MTEVVAADIGGTHARFALTEVAEGRVLSLGEACTLRTSDHASLQTAWEEFSRQRGRALPDAVAIAVAAPIDGEMLKLTNNPWVIRPALIGQQLGVSRFTLVNDFGAVGHAVAQLGGEWFRHVCGPEAPLPSEGVISIVGPGTGLGVGQLLRRDGRYHVIETEGGHVDFAPLDSIEDAILLHLRGRYRRVSTERIASGPGLANIYEALSILEHRPIAIGDDTALWTAALAGSDSLAAAALDRFCLSLGAISGDIALAQGRGRGGDRRRDWASARRPPAELRLCQPLRRQGALRAADERDAGQAHHSSAARPVRRRRRLRPGACPLSAIDHIMRIAPVIPVLVIDDAATARPIAEALVAGGLKVLEVTLRTPAALAAIREMAKVPGAVVGAGTVLNERDLAAALDAGAEFIVSPGLTGRLGQAAAKAGVPFLPGIASAGDIMHGLDLGLDRFKFFPAEAAGGLTALRALAAPFGEVRFCPTGGITAATAPDWLAEPSVQCVGGSWIVAKGQTDLAKIEQAARAAAAFARFP